MEGLALDLASRDIVNGQLLCLICGVNIAN